VHAHLYRRRRGEIEEERRRRRIRELLAMMAFAFWKERHGVVPIFGA